MLWPAKKGPEVTSVLTTETSADDVAVPPLPVVSVLLPGTGSDSVPFALAVLSNAAAALIVAGTKKVAVAPTPSGGVRHRSAAQPPPLTVVMGRVEGVSGTWKFR